MIRVKIGKFVFECDSAKEAIALQREFEMSQENAPRPRGRPPKTKDGEVNGRARNDLALLRVIADCADGIDSGAVVERLKLKAPRGLGAIIGAARQKLERLGFDLDSDVMLKYASGGGTTAWRPGNKIQEAIKALEEETAK